MAGKDRLGITVCLLVLATPAALATVACANATQDVTNADLYAAFAEEVGDQDYVVATADSASTRPEDPRIDPSVPATVAQQLAESYHRDIERCVEAEMERLDTRWLAGDLAVALHIGEDGRVTQTRMLEGELRERRSPGGAPLQGEARVADGFHECVDGVATSWEFAVELEHEYVHTHHFTVKEAW